LAGVAKSVTGIEANPSLFETACLRSSPANVAYTNANLFDVDFAQLRFDMAYMYEVVQHLNYQQLLALAERLFGGKTGCRALFVGGVPDETRKWLFYDTAARRIGQAGSLFSGADPIGTWYHPDHLRYLADRLDVHVEIFEQPQALYTAHYRFDALFRVKGGRT